MQGLYCMLPSCQLCHNHHSKEIIKIHRLVGRCRKHLQHLEHLDLMLENRDFCIKYGYVPHLLWFFLQEALQLVEYPRPWFFALIILGRQLQEKTMQTCSNRFAVVDWWVVRAFLTSAMVEKEIVCCQWYDFRDGASSLHRPLGNPRPSLLVHGRFVMESCLRRSHRSSMHLRRLHPSELN